MRLARPSTGALSSKARRNAASSRRSTILRQDAARQGDPPGRDEGHRHVAGEARHDPPIEPETRRLLAFPVGERRRGDGLRLNVRIGCPFRHHARTVNTRESGAGNDAFARHPPVGALEMRPDGEFFRLDRAKIDMASLRGDRGEAPIRLHQRGDAKPGARPQNHLRALGPKLQRADAPLPTLRNCRQRQGLGLEIVEQQALREPRAARGFRAVHHPRRIGELERPPDNRPSAAGNHRAGARAELGNGRLDRLGQPRIITGAQVDDVAETAPRLA